MKNNSLFKNLLLGFTIASPPLAFSICAIVGEAEIFGVAGIIRYSWIILLFIPFGILTLLAGKKEKECGRKYTRFYVAACISLPLLLVFGSYRFIVQGISYSVSDVYTIEEKTNLDFPNSIRLAAHDYSGNDVLYIKIADVDEAASFSTVMSSNVHCTLELGAMVQKMLPLDIQLEIVDFDYFLWYDLTTDQYTTSPSVGEHKYVFIAYDCQVQKIIILDNYEIGHIQSVYTE